MRAAVLEHFDEPLNVTSVDDPEPGHGEVIVRTRAAGICRTDLKVIGGAIPSVTTPRIPGHELAGEIVAVGPGVSRPGVGARVTVSLDFPCGECDYCLIGELDHCSQLVRMGLEQDGALAEYVRVPAATTVEIPDDLDFVRAATIPDAVGSPYHAVLNRAQVKPAQTVAVYGLGGLGLNAVQIAALTGARVIGIARTPERRTLAEELGATWTIDPNDAPIPDQILDITGGLGVHAFIDVVGIEDSVGQGVLSLRKGGRVVVLGYLVPELTAQMMRLVIHEAAILGSRGSTRKELREAVQLVGQGLIDPIIGAEFGLDEVNAGLQELRDGEIIGRAVVTFD